LRACGGVLEHPAHSRLWDELKLPKPGQELREGLWSMEIWQAWFGYAMKKKTWLLFAGITPEQLPPIPYVLHDQGKDRRRQQVMSKHQRAATCPALAKWLVEVASLSDWRES